jgi:hypothetical protein
MLSQGRSSFMLSLMLLSVGLFAQSPKSAPSDRALVGEWAVEWEDPKKKETEIIYVQFTQEDGVLSGSALDPNLIPATISGEIKNLRVTFRVDPNDGGGWAAAPTSMFKGRMTGAGSMEGRWSFSLFNRGSWKAWPTFAATPSVTATAKTIVRVRLSLKEYEFLKHDYHETRRVGDEIEVLNSIEGWLYRYRLFGQSVRINPNSQDSLVRRQAQEKILGALNKNGYPWTKIPR